MSANQAALAAAARMGARRGELFHDTGIPTACPFTAEAEADLAAAWGRAYLAAVQPQRLGPRTIVA